MDRRVTPRRVALAPGRAVALLSILLFATLLPMAPPALAQQSVVLCFDHDEQCGATLSPKTPNYLQGDRVGIFLQNIQDARPLVRVECVTGCHEVEGKQYFARWAGSRLHFPDNFYDSADGRGSNAVADRAPRYNGTWRATVELPAGQETSRTFDVWLFTQYASPNLTVRPGEAHFLRAAGFDPDAPVEFRIERRSGPPGSPYTPVLAPTSPRANGLGDLELEWQVPKDEATRIRECGINRQDCYRIVLRGTGKQDEIIPFSVDVAQLIHNPQNSVLGPSQNAALVESHVERTRKVTVALDLFYPGGRYLYNQQAKLKPGDVPEHGLLSEAALPVAVEKLDVRNETPERVDVVAMRYQPQRFRWEAEWTVPRDATPDTVYRLRLIESRDAWGNIVPARSLGNWTIEAATLTPVIVEVPVQVERTEEATMRLAIKYHNGSVLGDQENATTLRGCFVRAQQTSCTAQNRVEGSWEGEHWVFRFRYARDYAFLSEHRFLFEEGARDHWGNTVQPARSDPFDVVKASPRVNFTTVMRGLDVQTLERGNYVSVQALVTYHDGSPFNHTVRENESHVLSAALTRRGPGGAIMFQEAFNLTQTDSESGRFIGGIRLTHDDTLTPLGVWTWSFHIRDNLSVPNENRTSFDREVVGAPIQMRPTFQPPTNAPTGSTVKFRYKLFYVNADGEREVERDAIGTRVTARVYPYDRDLRAPEGAPISNVLQPLFNERTQDWSIEYVVPPQAFRGTYTIVLGGTDIYGNRLSQDAWSRSFTTYPQVVERGVLTEPAAEVRRGESATVVFDAHEGDRGPTGDAPFVSIERWDAATSQWVREVRDVRQAAGFEDHVGFFPITITMPVGIYRFSLDGVDKNLNLLEAHSSNFTVLSTQVTRAIVTPPPERAVKGDAFAFAIEYQDGDRVVGSEILLNGRRINMPPPVMHYTGRQVNVTWEAPFDAPSGNYTIHLIGRDLSGNVLDVYSPPIRVEVAELAGRILGEPSRVVSRGDSVSILFGITYPTGSFYLAPDAPRVSVYRGDEYVDAAEVTRQGLTFSASWTPSATAESGAYHFEVSGQGSSGNIFPTLTTATFRVTPGTLTRTPAQEVTAGIVRLESAAFAVPMMAEDEYVGFTLEYYGSRIAQPGQELVAGDPVTTTTLPHTLDGGSGRYVVRFVTDQQTPTGTYRIRMEGEDRHSNRLVAESGLFVLRATSIDIQWDAYPPQAAFGEGKTIQLSFSTRYRTGGQMDETHGRPSAVVLYNGVPVQQRPEIEYRDGRWHISWTAPATLPDGEYVFTVGGADTFGNTIASRSSIPYIITSSLPSSFAKTVPGPEPALLIFGLAALALGLARARRRA